MSVVFTVALTLLVSYLLGCFNGSVMTSHFIIRDDVRQHGSGNAGLTNFYRTYGARYALCVILCDMGKTVLACLIGGYLMHWVVGDWTLGLLIAGIGCELGHMFPVFFGLRGGKGILSGGVLVLVCAVCFAVHILVIDHFTATCDGVKLSCLQFLFAGTWSTILALFFDTISFQVLLDCIWPLLYVGVFSCGVGYTLQILAQKGSNPTVVTILLSLESVFAVIAGAVVLHQQMTAREYLGCVLMFAAVVLAQIPMPQKKEAKAE